ncbi:putative disease resistance RPP13-like protein 1 [Ziziphus jujuba]|uniref:Disease resistance RPP13-like protein 1 n=1 Tax=Ziziphus jujuba TaxID=326968 RepID=A0ABM3IRV8_ZIZJJ|nr:putative disease resistance RPP13-like protein 1 [Ziziphus jujuba]XP_060672031.1 putative disease resistance RPP13-like protein 1 [Ziziphus jujuba]
MADKVVGESVLSASLQVSFRRNASQEFVDFVRRNKFDEVLDDLKKVLVSVSKVLNDAEIKRFSNVDVRVWFDFLENYIYEAEDLVYRIYTEAEEESASSSSSISKQVSNFQLHKIIESIKFIVEKVSKVGLIEGVEIDSFQRSSSSSETSNLAYICGRDAERKAIIDLLLPDKDWHKISVIPIVGEVGIGKATLTQLVYMDIHNNSNKPFDVKAWITVGDKFDVFTIVKGIYRQAVTDSPNCHIGNPYELQLELNKSLEGKGFLFVLDDVRTPNFGEWCAIKRMFSFASHGSKILVTTRFIAVGSGRATVPICKLGLLSHKDCWQLFSKRVFNNVDPRAYRDLEEIGRQIVKKCRGAPLAVILLAGLLCTNLNTVKWKNVLNNEIWRSHGPTDFPALSLSHRHLPNHLKQCFAYCSIFPRGYGFQKEKLILLWMAQDLLLPQNNKMLEEVGEEYFNDLESRSFFQKSVFCDFTRIKKFLF